MLINGLTEMHSHILPGVDDGSKSVEMSLEMIDMLKSQGADAIVLTPHYYSNRISLDDFLKKRDNAFAVLNDALPENSPLLIPAAEVYISDYLFNYENLNSLCIGKSRYVLMEHRFTCDFGEDTMGRLNNLECDYNIKPVLAHIERYDALMDDEGLLEEYVDMGCLTQVNISSFADAHKKVRKKLFKYLEHGLIHLIGSDCHNIDRRPPDYQSGLKEITKKYGTKPIEDFERNAKALINGKI